MKSPYSCLYREIWNDEKFWGLPDSSQLVYIHLLSTPIGNGIGCYKAGLEMLAEDKRMDAKAYRKAFAEVLSNALIEYNEKHRVVWIPKYIERNEPGNPNVLKSWGRIFAVLPECDLKAKCFHAIKDYAEAKSEAFHKAFGEAFDKDYPKESGNMALSPSPSETLSPSKKTRSLEGESLEQKDFDAFWNLYPRRKAKLDAQKAWKQTVKTRPAIDVLLGAIRTQLRDPQWQKGIIPLPASWLRGERWNDEPEKGSGGHTVGRLQPQEFPPDPIDDTPPATAEQIAEITGSGGVAAIEAREAREAEREKTKQLTTEKSVDGEVEE